MYANLKASHSKKLVCEGRTSMNVLNAFPAFAANSWGLYKARAPLAVKCINQTIPALLELAAYNRSSLLQVEPIDTFLAASSTADGAERLRSLFNQYGSDKGGVHNYHLAYDRVIGNPEEISKVLEIGLGTNNVDIVSTMGNSGKPGASLRAFRDYCSSASVMGADFDERVLFTEDRIQTFFVDQTEVDTFTPLGNSIGVDFDLMIDDGLHAPNANLHSLSFFLPRLKVGGWAVIEDIALPCTEIWKLVSIVVPTQFRCHLVRCKKSLMFLVNRLE